MNKIKLLSILAVIILLLNACNISQSTDVNKVPSNTQVEEAGRTDANAGNNTSNSVQPSTQVENKKSSDKEIDKLVERYVSAINNRDVDLMRQFVENNWGSGGEYEAGEAECILDDYRVVFQNSSNVEYKFIGPVPNTGDEAYIYDLFDDNGKVMEIQIYKFRDAYRIADTCFNYSSDVHHVIKFYTDQLKSKDPENLVGFFIPEGQTDMYPINDAKKTLEKYTQEIDLSTIEYKLKDIVRNIYIYDVYGTQNGEIVRHDVTVGCSNGLTGIGDTWMPQDSE